MTAVMSGYISQVPSTLVQLEKTFLVFDTCGEKKVGNRLFGTAFNAFIL